MIINFLVSIKIVHKSIYININNRNRAIYRSMCVEGFRICENFSIINNVIFIRGVINRNLN